MSEDAYRLYNVGVAYEALAYQAEDETTAMKFLDEAAINYGKAIDAKPAEKYFLEPQKRIETAIEHYKKLEDQKNQKTVCYDDQDCKHAGQSERAPKLRGGKSAYQCQGDRDGEVRRGG